MPDSDDDDIIIIRRQTITSAAKSPLVTADERSLLLDTAMLLEQGREPDVLTRWRVRRIVGRVVAG